MFELALINPHAGGGRARALVPRLRNRLSEVSPRAVLYEPDTVEQARDALHRCAPHARVVIAGGDGTVHQLLPVIIERGLELALLPCGSGNDTARALGLHGLPFDAALRVASSGGARRIDVGEARFGARAVPFVSSLSAGFDAAVCRRALDGPRWLTGLPRYLRATLAEIAHLRLWNIVVRADGAEVHRGPALFAASLNTPTFGSGMPAVPAARIADGRLDLLLAGRFGRAGALRMLPRLMAGRHLGDPRVVTRPYRSLVIECDLPLPLAADGEYQGETPLVEVSVRPAALAVVLPEASDSGDAAPAL